MPKQKLFEDDSEEEVSLKLENEYAKKYDTWREKEEIHKLEQKYGPKALNSDASISSDSEDQSDEPVEVSEEVEEQFLKTLALLKTKDPRIYDPSYKFFEDKQKEEVKETKKKTLTFADSDEDDNEDGNIFSIEKKAEIVDDDTISDKTKSYAGKVEKLKDFLTGKVQHIDNPVEKDLEPLKALWSDPKLNEGEAFLRDYILNKKYLEVAESSVERLRDDEALEADAHRVEEQGQFERAYNFRFQEPDQEYLKRFPRTMNYIRPKDDRRSRKRAEVRDRKDENKRQKLEEITRLKALKLKEIQEKIAKIKEVTGNDDLAFKEEDIEGDFDPEQHDRCMRAVFDDQYYGDADEEKPVFPDLDDELEIENWDKFEEEQYREQVTRDDGAHCEDEHFNMDADYEPKQARANLMLQIQSTLGKKRRNRKKKSKLAKLLSTEKPKYMPGSDKSYDQFMEEYYKMDCEDVIGDLPTRFKYREVVPNDYGLTIEEILLADDKELTQWVPLKRIVRHRPESVQRSEVYTYRQRAADSALKRKILPSLWLAEPELVVPNEKKKKKNKRKNKDKVVKDTENDEPSNNVSTELNGEGADSDKKNKDRKNSAAADDEDIAVINTEQSQEIINNEKETIAITKKKKHKNVNVIKGSKDSESEKVTAKRKNKNKKAAVSSDGLITSTQVADVGGNKELSKTENDDNDNAVIENKKKQKKKNGAFKVENVLYATPSQDSEGKPKQGHNLKRKAASGPALTPNKKKKNNAFNLPNNVHNRNNKNFKKDFNMRNNNSSDDPLSKLSDERLKAYGLNPKKYRSFLKYKKF